MKPGAIVRPLKPRVTSADVEGLEERIASAAAIVRTAIVKIDTDRPGGDEMLDLLRGAELLLDGVDLAGLRWVAGGDR